MTGVTAEIAARLELRKEAKARSVDSVRLGPESFAPATPDIEIIEVARAVDDLGRERS